jgi:YbbR domain-containing protein
MSQRQELWARLRPLLWDPGRWLAAVRRNFLLKALSVVAAFCVWLFVNAGARDTERALQAPLELRNIPPNLMITSPRVDFIDLRASGPRTLLSRIDRANLVIPLDLTGVRPGPAVFGISTETLNLPRGVKIVRITPSQVTLDLAKVDRRTVPVRLDLRTETADGLMVASTKISPQAVEVVGPANELKQIKHVDTEPVALSVSEPGPQQLEVPLRSLGEYFSLSAQRVAVEVRVESPSVTREIKAAVEVRNSGYAAAVKPREVRLQVRGPKRVLGPLELGKGAVYIDAAAFEPGSHVVTPAVELPLDVEVVQMTPPSVQLSLSKSRPRR